MSDEHPIESHLFRDRKPTAADSEVLLAQYQLFVETSEALVVRRQHVNTFFLSVNSLVLAAAGLLLRDGKLSALEAGALVCLSLGGCVLSFVWRRLISSFRQLSKGKFDVIHALEQHLPARLFTAEWEALGCGKDPNKYRPFTKTESTTPYVFALLHIVLICVILGLLVIEKKNL